MTTKQNIDFGESLIKNHQDILDSIKLLRDIKDDKKSIEFLLEITELEYQNRLDRDSKNLENHKKNYLTEFEHASLECNVHVGKLVEIAKKHIGTTLNGVSGVIEEIKPLTDQYDDKSVWGDYDQEKRNEVYFKLKSLINAIQKIK